MADGGSERGRGGRALDYADPRDPEPEVPHRIVSLVPSHTETLHDLGLADRVVGRTRFCIHPKPWIDSIAMVGGTKDARLDKILALNPDLVVADRDENPKALVEALTAAGVAVLWSEIANVPQAVAFIEELGERCGVPDTAHLVAENTLRTLLQVRQAGEPIPVFCPIWHDPWMTFDVSSYPHAMLAAAGLHNVFAEHGGPRYFPVTLEEVAATRPAWTLLPTEPFPFHKQRDRIDTAPIGPGGRSERVRIIDGEALTWFGTRTERGLRELARVAADIRRASA